MFSEARIPVEKHIPIVKKWGQFPQIAITKNTRPST